MIKPPDIEIGFMGKMLILGAIVFGGAIMVHLRKIINWIRGMDEE
jgi:hypothetical protein